MQNMEKDKALERRFQQVYVKQPNVEDTVSARRQACLADCSGQERMLTQVSNCSHQELMNRPSKK